MVSASLRLKASGRGRHVRRWPSVIALATSELADEHLRPMEVQVALLGRLKRPHVPVYGGFLEPEALDRELVEAKTPKVKPVDPRRWTDGAILPERDEATIEKVIGIRREQQAVHPIEPLGGCLAKVPGFDMARAQE